MHHHRQQRISGITLSLRTHPDMRRGGAFYVPPGHTTSATAGSEFLVFSPAEQLRETEAAMAGNMKALQDV
jgi:hypothetical protein